MITYRHDIGAWLNAADGFIPRFDGNLHAGWNAHITP